jgi:uncharacterized protein Yka (UPF0111/DUF47 family)
MWSRLLPKKPEFFALFSSHADCCVEGARVLEGLLGDPKAADARVAQIHAVEHRADAICQRTMETLHGSFITPIERTDIHQLSSRLDDIMDHIEATAQCISLYEIAEPMVEVIDMGRNVVRATEAMKALVDALGQGLEAERMRELGRVVKGVEKENDRVLRRAIARLFKDQRDPVLLIKWKDIYEDVEAAVDRCEDVANIIEGVVLENN